MIVKAYINIDTPEGREIVERLRRFPDVVTFDENDTLNEPQAAYTTKSETEDLLPEGYMAVEEFRGKMHEFVEKQYAK